MSEEVDVGRGSWNSGVGMSVSLDKGERFVREVLKLAMRVFAKRRRCFPSAPLFPGCVPGTVGQTGDCEAIRRYRVAWSAGTFTPGNVPLKFNGPWRIYAKPN